MFKDIDFTKAYAILELGRISEREKDTMTTVILKCKMLEELKELGINLNK